MKLQKLRILFFLAILGSSLGSFAQDSTKIFTLSGTIDTYARTAFGTSNDYGAYGPSTSFADLKGFSLGMANLIASFEGEKVGFVADLVFGPRGQAAVFGTASGQAIINQMYAYYKLSDAVTINMGQFNTFLGYEVISPAVNFHYSTSYLFSYGPFNHTGVRADFNLGGGFVGKLALMNPTDIVEFNPVNTYTLGAQVGKSGDKGGIWLNFLYGDQDGTLDKDDDFLDEDDNLVTSAGKLFQADVTAGWDLTETFYLGVNASYQSTDAGEGFTGPGTIVKSTSGLSSFAGFAVYPKLSLSEHFALGLRAEYFAVTNNHLSIFGMDDNGDGSVTAFTLSGSYNVGGFTFIPEFRIDKTSQNSFTNKGGSAKDIMSSLTMAAVYQF